MEILIGVTCTLEFYVKFAIKKAININESQTFWTIQMSSVFEMISAQMNFEINDSIALD